MNTPDSGQTFAPQIRQRPAPQALLDALRARFGAQFSAALAVREQHGRDESAYTTVPPPAAVVFAESASEVQDTVRLCAQYKTPVIAFAASSSLEGQVLAVQGGVSIDVLRMNRIVSVNPEDLTVTVQPGVTRRQLNDALRNSGMFFPIDPGADATIGGMTATRASGTNTVRYGTMRENVLMLQVVTASVREQAETVQAMAGEHRGEAFEWAAQPEERTRLWTARHNAYFAGVQSKPGCRVLNTDVCVPISRLADALLDSVAEADASSIPYFLVGHVGDGNFHFGYLIDPDSAQERAAAEALNHKLVARALALGGTCTGEHGVGMHKMGFLHDEAGDGALATMRAIKRALDPHNILNPGKILD